MTAQAARIVGILGLLLCGVAQQTAVSQKQGLLREKEGIDHQHKIIEEQQVDEYDWHKYDSEAQGVLRDRIRSIANIFDQKELENQALRNKVQTLYSELSRMKEELHNTPEKHKMDKAVSAQQQEIADLRQKVQTLSQELSQQPLNSEAEQSSQDKAESLASELIKIKAQNKKEKAVLYERLGTAYIQAGLYNDAVQAYEQSLRHDSSNYSLYYYLGLLYEYKAKDSFKAVAALRKYLQCAPHGEYNEKAKDIIALLE